ncbi:hypothetical protein BGX28_007520 [Mortierella sp. GBA30]|nr:hypothetical protein BGX28_007520 [Mortierella sp. GBA30]
MIRANSRSNLTRFPSQSYKSDAVMCILDLANLIFVGLLIAQAFAQDPTPVTSMAYTTLGDQLFIHGGTPDKLPNGTQLAAIDQFAMLPLSGSWSTSKPPWTHGAPMLPLWGHWMVPLVNEQGILLANPLFYGASELKFAAYSTSTSVWLNPFMTAGSVMNKPGLKAVVSPSTGFVYVPTGQDTNMLVIDPSRRTASQIPMPAANIMSPAVTYYAAVWSNARNSILIYGGTAGLVGNPNLVEFEPVAATWRRLDTTGPSPGDIAKHCMVPAYNGTKLVVFGGLTISTQVPLAAIYSLDVASLVWTKGADVDPTQRRSNMACAAAGENFVAWGGDTNGMNMNSFIKPIVYNLRTNQWTDQFTLGSPATNTGTGATSTSNPTDSTSAPKSPPSGDVNRAAIGGGVGGAIVIVVVVFCVFKRHKSKVLASSKEPDFDMETPKNVNRNRGTRIDQQESGINIPDPPSPMDSPSEITMIGIRKPATYRPPTSRRAVVRDEDGKEPYIPPAMGKDHDVTSLDHAYTSSVPNSPPSTNTFPSSGSPSISSPNLSARNGSFSSSSFRRHPAFVLSTGSVDHVHEGHRDQGNPQVVHDPRNDINIKVLRPSTSVPAARTRRHPQGLPQAENENEKAQQQRLRQQQQQQSRQERPQRPERPRRHQTQPQREPQYQSTELPTHQNWGYRDQRTNDPQYQSIHAATPPLQVQAQEREREPEQGARDPQYQSTELPLEQRWDYRDQRLNDPQYQSFHSALEEQRAFEQENEQRNPQYQSTEPSAQQRWDYMDDRQNNPQYHSVHSPLQQERYQPQDQVAALMYYMPPPPFPVPMPQNPHYPVDQIQDKSYQHSSPPPRPPQRHRQRRQGREDGVTPKKKDDRVLKEQIALIRAQQEQQYQQNLERLRTEQENIERQRAEQRAQLEMLQRRLNSES